MIKKITYIWILLSSHLVLAQTPSDQRAYTHIQAAKIKGIQTVASLNSTSLTDKASTINYFDANGRPDQTITMGVTPGGNHAVRFYEYNDDNRGVQEVSYLPYTSSTASGAYITDAIGDQATYYSSESSIGHDTAPWSKVEYYNTPDKRLLRAGGVGSGYQLDEGYYSKNELTFNTSTDKVLEWEITENGTLYPAANLYYGSNELSKTISTQAGADGRITYTYTNHLGQHVCTRYYNGTEQYDMYHVYDDYGDLRFTVPPEASKMVRTSGLIAVDDDHVFSTHATFLVSAATDEAYYYVSSDASVTLSGTKTFTDGFSISAYDAQVTADDEGANEELAAYVFAYKYNNRNQLISKNAPGAAAVYYVYDRSGRLILSQDGNQRSDNQWTFTKYDTYDRPILTGELTDTRSRSVLETYLYTEITTGTKRSEVRGTSIHGYTNTVWPRGVSTDDYLVVSYYDDYDFMDASWSDLSYDASETGYEGAKNVYPQKTETGGKIKILGTSTWLKSAKYYDDEYYLIQAASEHHRGGIDRVYSLQDEWSGRVLQNRFTHEVDASKTIIVDERFEYDTNNNGLLLAQYHSIDGETEFLIASYDYNELGELIEKNLHQQVDEDNDFVQSVDYRRNIRNQLTNINQASKNSMSGEGDDNPDRFGMQLYYDTNPTGLTFDTKTNGLLSGVTWGTTNMTGTATQRSYGYSYDGVQRLTGATYREGNGTTWNTKVGYHNVSNITYDLNGNIKTLDRKADNTTIDNLSYTYEVNQLKSINDATNNDLGFKDGAELSVEYSYDANGNMISDANKLISSMTYNQFNKPEVITFTNGDHIDYTYDAGGARLSMIVHTGGEIYQTDYCSGIIYEEDIPTFMSLPNGRVVIEKVAADYNYDYQYVLTDHLGNTRAIVLPALRTYIATMETGSSDKEEAQFLNLSQSRSSNEAKGGSYSARLNPKYGDIVGSAKALKVYDGEIIDLEVSAKYEDLSSYSQNGVNAIVFDAVSSAFGVSSGEVFNALSSQLGGVSLLAQSSGEIPAAYINYILFDNDYNVVQSGFEQIDTRSKGKFQFYDISIIIPQEGYLFTYLSNESSMDVDVYFDNFTVEHDANASVQHVDDYYPFGMPIASNAFKDVGQDENRFKYQGKEWQTALALNLYDFHARQYDPATGRFTGVDPKGQFASSYVGMGNRPTSGIDPDGKIFFDPLLKAAISLARGQNVIDEVGQYLDNEVEIIRGLFSLDQDKDDWGKFTQLVKRHTWQGITTQLGHQQARLNNLFGTVEKVEFFHGTTVIYKDKTKDGSANSVGGYITLPRYNSDGVEYETNYGNDLLLHEYGHYLQEQAWGPLTIISGITSGLSLMGLSTLEDHHDSYTELDANARSLEYFKEKDDFNNYIVPFGARGSRSAESNFTKKRPGEKVSHKRWLLNLFPLESLVYGAFVNTGT